ncbi:MAG TPA: universal stress protein [Chitinophagaceae bacterium]|jgi:nucleotide-binding universal stress UspA family protein|nr:universal stress protein [Chitinophagaceae bacterium]
MSHILIALDFSKYSPEVEKVGFALAKKIGASVTLVTIINKFIDYVPADTGQVFENQWEARKDIAEKTLNEIKNNHIDVLTDIVTYIGDPKEDIIRLSVDRHSTFIVMGTHGRTGLSHLVMGSTAEYILRHSMIPVIVVPLNKIKFEKD